MKNILIALIILLSFVQCKKDDVSPEITAKLGEDFKLKLNQVVVLPSNSSEIPSMKLKLTYVQDGFCPPNGNCITAGSAYIKVGKEEDNYLSPIESCKGDCDRTKPFTEVDSTTFTYNNQGYRLIFKSIHSDYDEKKFKKTFKDITLLVEKL